MDVDETDVKILKHLEHDGRRSYRSIAKEIGVSTMTVVNRVKAMQDAKILKFFTTFVDAEKVGYELTAIINVNTQGKYLVNLLKKWSAIPQVCGVYNVTGDTDVVLIVRFKSVKDMDKFLKEVQSYEGVHKTITQLAVSTIKQDFRVKFL